MNILVGKTILSVLIAKDRQAIKFITNDGDVVARCDADCCSETWIEHVELPASFPALVLSAGNLDLDKEDSWTEEGHECVAFYGFKAETDKGSLVIDYRNSSNGYYGGSLEWPPSDYFYGGVFGQNVSKEEWQEIES